MADSAAPPPSGAEAPYPLPRITIQFCTQCKWMLRAAYFAQELLSTFSTSLGEVALQPGTGGVFVVSITHGPAPPSGAAGAAGPGGEGPAPAPRTRVLWDRRADGGFPETKELKRRVRDVIDPSRDLGHVDRDHGGGGGGGGGGREARGPAGAAPPAPAAPAPEPGEILAAFKAEQERRHAGARPEEAQEPEDAAAAGGGAAGGGSCAKGDGHGEGYCEDCA